MSDDLARFLKRVADRRAQQMQPPPVRSPVHSPGPPIEYVEAEPAPTPADVSSTLAQPSDGQAMSRKDFNQRASQLGEEVGLADDKMDEHVHDVFDHEVGKLHSREDEREIQQPPHSSSEENPAAQIVRLLSNPPSLRIAFILGEIFNPPHRDW